MTILLGFACNKEASEADLIDEHFIKIEIDRSNNELFLTQYFFPYSQDEEAGLFESGLLIKQNDDYYLDADKLRSDSLRAVVFKYTGSDGKLDEEALESFIIDTYYQAIRAPATLDTLLAASHFNPSSPDWFEVSLRGVMTSALRRIYVPVEALQAAISRYHEQGRILYPEGTVFIGQHEEGGRLLETTVMRKVRDRYWHYLVYDKKGSLSRRTQAPPRPLKVPVQCVGCHYGSKLFEPEKSFPAPALPGPHGERKVYVEPGQVPVALVQYFDEHRKRSDGVLGLYATLYAAELMRRQREGEPLTSEEVRLLEAIDYHL